MAGTLNHSNLTSRFRFPSIVCVHVCARVCVCCVRSKRRGKVERTCFPLPFEIKYLSEETKRAFLNSVDLSTAEKRMKALLKASDNFIEEMAAIYKQAEMSRTYRSVDLVFFLYSVPQQYGTTPNHFFPFFLFFPFLFLPRNISPISHRNHHLLDSPPACFTAACTPPAWPSTCLWWPST